MAKKKKNNTPKQVSYLVRFNTTEEDFPKEREDLFKAQLSAFMRDSIPMDMPEITPYKREPISLEKKDYDKLFTIHSDGDIYCENWEWSDFMNSHHFDYRGLIPKDLAIEAPEGMYK